MRRFNSCSDKTRDLRYKNWNRRPLGSCWPQSHRDKSPLGSTVHRSAVQSKGPASFLLDMGRPNPVLTAGLGRVNIWTNEGFSFWFFSAPILPPLLRHAQSFFLLALFMFSWRFCFFFCSRSRASIILASFQDSSALAMNRGVRAKMTDVRKP